MRIELVKPPRWILPLVAVLLVTSAVGAAAEQEPSKDARPAEEREVPRSRESPQPTPGPARQPAFELVGVTKLDGERSAALLREPVLTEGAPVFVRQGQSIGPYRLVAVEDDRVRLESANGAITVRLGGSKDTDSVPEPPDSVPEPSMTAEESVAKTLKGTRGEKVLNTFKKALGLGVNP
jgi:hypothetical protein